MVAQPPRRRRSCFPERITTTRIIHPNNLPTIVQLSFEGRAAAVDRIRNAVSYLYHLDRAQHDLPHLSVHVSRVC